HAIERYVDLDLAVLYEAPMAERVDRYLEVPRDALADALPRWKTTADVTPSPDSVEHLPFVVADLAHVRCPTGEGSRFSVATADPISSFMRGRDGRFAGDGGTAADTRSEGPARTDDDPIVDLQETDSMEHVWIGEGYPMGAAKPTVEACKRRFDARPSGDIDVTVVVNDPEMRAETAVSDLYGLRELVQFDVGTHEALSQEELASLLAEDRDFVHFVGHVDDRGLQCADGYLDAAALDDVGTGGGHARRRRKRTGDEGGADAGAAVERGVLAGRRARRARERDSHRPTVHDRRRPEPGAGEQPRPPDPGGDRSH
ncbi:hypothetical protein BRC94_00005, partial [Halobacteriales archaeon QS_5_70_17]